MKREHVPSLNDLAFNGRNKSYGAYFLRKKYPRNLWLALFISVLFATVVFLTPLAVYYFDPIPLQDNDLIYEVPYFNMMNLPDEDLNRLAQALSVPVREVTLAPVVSDSLSPEKQIPIEQKNSPDVPLDEVAKSDTLPTGPGSSGFGPGTGDDTGLATVIDVYPRFPGGDEARLYFLRKNIHYPEAAQKKMIQGVVIVIFIIEADGNMSNIEIAKGIGGGCDEEALRVARSMPRWDPGKRSGKPVRVMVKMPVVFRLPGKLSR